MLTPNDVSLIILFLFIHQLVWAQTYIDSISVSNVSIYSGDFTPYFLQSNTNGIVDRSGNNSIISLVAAKHSTESHGFKYGYGLNLIGRISNNNALYFNELYSSVSYSSITFTIGRFVDVQGLSELFLGEHSVGSLMVSKNANPFPKLKIETNRWIDVPYTGDLLRWKFTYAHGVLDDNRYVKNTFVHQKTFYLNMNLSKFQGYAGFIHNVQWGGSHPELGQLPHSFLDYLTVVTGFIKNPNTVAVDGESSNVIGNSIAAYDVGFTWTFKPVYWSLYRIFYHEDTVSLRLRNVWDGVWGGSLNFRNPFFSIRTVGFEYVNMTRLGKRNDLNPPEPNGTDNPYNHWLYESGWTYHGRTLGIPLFLTENESETPLFSQQEFPIVNNIVVAHHVFMNGSFRALNYTLRFIKSYNYGTYKDMILLGMPYTLNRIEKIQNYTLIDLHTSILKTKSFKYETGVRLAMDFGKLYNDRFGIQFLIKIIPNLN